MIIFRGACLSRGGLVPSKGILQELQRIFGTLKHWGLFLGVVLIPDLMERKGAKGKRVCNLLARYLLPFAKNFGR